MNLTMKDHQSHTGNVISTEKYFFPSRLRKVILLFAEVLSGQDISGHVEEVGHRQRYCGLLDTDVSKGKFL